MLQRTHRRFFSTLKNVKKFRILDGGVKATSEQYRNNFEYNNKLLNQLKTDISVIKQGGGSKNVAKHEQRGKLFVRDRIDQLIDQGTSFLELSQVRNFIFIFTFMFHNNFEKKFLLVPPEYCVDATFQFTLFMPVTPK